MEKRRKQKIQYRILWILILGVLVALDQVVKHWSRSVLAAKKTIEVLPGWFSLTYVENRGAAFGMMQHATWFFSIISGIIILGILYYLIYCSPPAKMRGVLLLILAGAIGNLIDRLCFGFVTDMLDFHGIWRFVFNVADIYVVTGTGLLALVAFENQ